MWYSPTWITFWVFIVLIAWGTLERFYIFFFTFHSVTAFHVTDYLSFIQNKNKQCIIILCYNFLFNTLCIIIQRIVMLASTVIIFDSLQSSRYFLDLTKYADLTELLTHLLVRLLISFEQNPMHFIRFHSYF